MIIVIISEKYRVNLYLEKQKVIMMKQEYSDILEKFPEGILIVDEKQELKFMNHELRNALQVSEKHEEQGLH